MGTAHDVLVPLESNPEVMKKLLKKLGVSGPYDLVDVIGLDEEPLKWVPRPVLAVIMLFPVSDAYEEHKKLEEIGILSRGQEVSSDLFYLKQSLRNACGTIALIHSLANNLDRVKLEGGALQKFLQEAKYLDPVARGVLLESSADIVAAHKELAREGQTEQPNPNELVNHHFIAFVHNNGILYELDGSKAFPINHGTTSPDTLLKDAARVCREFIARNPSEVHFTVIALTSTE